MAESRLSNGSGDIESENTPLIIGINSSLSEQNIRKRKSKHGHGHSFNKNVMDSMESLDFKVFDNGPQRQLYIQSTKAGHWKRLSAKWAIYIILGSCLGALAYGLRQAIEVLNKFKYDSMLHFMDKKYHVYSFLVFYAINMLYSIVGSGTVFLCGPLVAGSGIPEVKGYLNGVRVVGLINLKTFIGKFISITFAYAGCLALGPEGPMVHIGSIIGAGLSAAKSRTLRIRLPKIFERLRGDREQRDFISSGAAAGVAAAFGAPIGGTLFAIEETSSFWSRELTWRTLFGCMVSSFMVNLITSRQGKMIGDYGLLTFGISRSALYRYAELLPFLFLGILGGLLGALFVYLNVALNRWRRDHIGKNPYLKFLEVLVVTTICALITFGIPTIFPCHPQSDIIHFDDICDNTKANATKPVYWFCDDESQYNEMANLMVIPAEDTLKLLFSRTMNAFSFTSLVIFLVTYYFMAVVTAGLAISAGLFVPMMLIGASAGRIVGKLMETIYPHLDPPIDSSIYALVGAAAMMSGFSRITISLCIIVIELTENTQYLLPIMLAALSAKWVGDALTKSEYEELSDLKSIPFLEYHPPHSAFRIAVTEVMAKPVACIKQQDSLYDIINILQTTKHNGFPVVNEDGVGREFTYRGFILRKQLLILLERQLYQANYDEKPAGMLDYEYYLSLMNHKWDLANISLPPPETQKSLKLDVSDYMDLSQVVVQSSFSFIEAYRLFQTQGLRHLPVVDDHFQVVGILTRHDLLYFHFAEGDERVSPEFFSHYEDE